MRIELDYHKNLIYTVLFKGDHRGILIFN